MPCCTLMWHAQHHWNGYRHLSPMGEFQRQHRRNCGDCVVRTSMFWCRVYCGGKAATHEDLRHLALFPPELIHMRTVVATVKSEAPFGCCTLDVAELRQTCTEVYNQEIITCHNNRIRRWIDKQTQKRLKDDQAGSLQQCSVPSQPADVGRMVEVCATGPALQCPMRGQTSSRQCW